MKRTVFRGVFYVFGLLLLAFGLTLNTKTGLGVSAIMMLSYVVSEVWELNFGNMTLVLYVILVAIQVVMHCTVAGKVSVSRLVRDMLQLPLSILFTRAINLINAAVPMLSEAYSGRFLGSLLGRIVALVIAVLCIGIGAAMTVNMQLVPNPADGFVQSLAERNGKRIGLVKNCVDLGSVLLSCLVALIFAHKLIGIGIGTLVTALGTGRVMHLFEQICRTRMLRLAGMVLAEEKKHDN